ALAVRPETTLSPTSTILARPFSSICVSSLMILLVERPDAPGRSFFKVSFRFRQFHKCVGVQEIDEIARSVALVGRGQQTAIAAAMQLHLQEAGKLRHESIVFRQYGV